MKMDREDMRGEEGCAWTQVAFLSSLVYYRPVPPRSTGQHSTGSLATNEILPQRGTH